MVSSKNGIEVRNPSSHGNSRCHGDGLSIGCQYTDMGRATVRRRRVKVGVVVGDVEGPVVRDHGPDGSSIGLTTGEMRNTKTNVCY